MTRCKRLMMRFAVTAGFVLVLGLQAAPVAALPDIYPSPDLAQADIDRALRLAGAEHRHVILDFGGNWCPDCHVLDRYFHDAANQPLLDTDFVLVYVNIGRRDRNVDLAARCGIPLEKGVPALAVLDSSGRLLYSQRAGEFEAMRGMQSAAVTDFLRRWRPGGSESVTRRRPPSPIRSQAA